MNKTILKLSMLVAIVFSAILAFRPTEAFAGITVGGGGSSAGAGETFVGGCGAGYDQVCNSTLWVYYRIIDGSQPIYIRSLTSNANDLYITADVCGSYEGVWVYQRTYNEQSAQGTTHYRVATGARTITSGVNRDHFGSTYYPKKGVAPDTISNIEPVIPDWPSCNSTCTPRNENCCPATPTSTWLVSEADVKSKFYSANGNSYACTINGTYYSDCFAAGSQLTYFCYGAKADPPKTTYTLTYNANGGKNAPNAKSCSTTGKSCSITVTSNKPTLSGATFLGWATSKTATKANASYAAGTKVSMTKNITLYAVWSSKATFSGTIASISSNSDSNIKKINGSNILGNGSATSFKIKTTYTITRTNSAPASASSKYTGSNSSQPPSAGTSTGDLKKDATKKVTGTKTAKQAVGTKSKHCFYLTYEDSVKYLGTTRQNNTATLDKLEKCATIYNPQYATFSASVKVTSSNMGGNQTDGFTGTGDTTTKYKLTATFTIKRSNSAPSTAKSRYNYSKNKKYPTAAGDNMITSALANGGTYKIPIDVSFTLDAKQSAEKCFSLTFDNRVGYIGTSILTSPFDTREFTGQKQICVMVYNPQKSQATFSGSITAKNGSNLTGSGETRTGNGLHSQYTLTPTYTVTRKNNSPSWAVAPRYNISDTKMPTTPLKDTLKELKKGESDSKTGKAVTFNVPISNTKTKKCFYLAFDNPVVYLDKKVSERLFNGKKEQCFLISNPPQKYSSNFTASTTGKIDKDKTTPERFTRDSKDPDHIATINNLVRNADGSNSYNYPSNDKYTATFAHTITRTDTDKSSTASTKYYVKNSNNKWKIQYCIYGDCDRGNYGDYKAELDNNTNVKVEGEVSLAAKAKATITTQPKWTLDFDNKGKYIYMCQRIEYDKKIDYETTTNEDNPKSYKNSVKQRTKTYTNPVCIIIKNPRWDQTTGGYLNHYIDVRNSGSSITAFTGAKKVNETTYEMTKLESTFTWDHTVKRYDNKTDVSGREKTNFDETATGINFYQTSIYSNNDFAVSTKVSGIEQIEGRKDDKNITPAGADSEGNLTISLRGINKNLGEEWPSTSRRGQTQTTFTANASSGEYLLLAGESKTVSQTTKNTPAAWRIQYRVVDIKESYSIPEEKYGSQKHYDHTERISAKPRECILEDGIDRDCRGDNDSNPDKKVPLAEYVAPNPTKYTITRPYNYKVTDVKPQSSSSDTATTYTGQSYEQKFDITVNQNSSEYEYITDLKNRKAFVVGYVIPSRTTTGVASTMVLGGRTASSSPKPDEPDPADVCSFFGDRWATNCKILENGQSEITPHKSDTNVYPVSGQDNGEYIIDYKTSITVPQVETGAKYCVALAIAQYSSSSTDWFISKSACNNVTKRPTVQVLGGDVRSNGYISGSTTKRKNKQYGSWSDFIVSASKTITGFASSASIANGVTVSNNSSEDPMCKLDALTISNEQCKDNPLATSLGEASIPITDTTDSILSKMKGYYLSIEKDSEDICDSERCRINGVDRINTGTFIANGLNDPSSFTSAKPIIISGSNILIETDIVLERNHVYDSEVAAQVIIIADGNVMVSDHVREIDAWIVAGGTFTSCALSNSSDLSADVCTEPLTIKGAIVASSINLNRTHGGDPNTDDDASIKTPAEKIYYSPMLLIQTAKDSKLGSEPQQTYVRELPPRK